MTSGGPRYPTTSITSTPSPGIFSRPPAEARTPKLDLVEYKNKAPVKQAQSQEAVLVIHGNYKTFNMSINFFDRLSTLTKAKRLPKLYSIESNSHDGYFFHKDLQNFHGMVLAIHQLISYVIEAQAIKKITIMAVDLGADAFLHYLSVVGLDFYQIMDKVILINCGYEGLTIFHTNYRSVYKRALSRFNETDRCDAINNARIVSIQTRRVSRKWPQSHSKLLLLSGRTPNKYLHVDSKYMWSVYCELSNDIAFYFQPFVHILAEFVAVDSLQSLGVKQIDYMLRYNQDPHMKPVSIYKREFALDCKDIFVANLYESKFFLDKGCWKFKFGSHTNFGMMMEADSHVKIFTEKFIQIPPFLSDSLKTVFYIKNLTSLNGIYVRNPNHEGFTLAFVRPLTVKEEDLKLMALLKTDSHAVHLPDIPLRICPETSLLFPMTDSTCIMLQTPILLQKPVTKIMKVYVVAIIDIYRELFRAYWALHKNSIVIYLFGLHMFGGNPYPLLGIEPIFMGLNLQDSSLQMLVLETLFSLSIAMSIFKTMRMVKVVSKLFSRLEEGEIYFYSAPLVFVITTYLCSPYPNPFNQWFSLVLTGITASKQPQIGVLNVIMLYLNFDYLLLKSKSFIRFAPMQALLLVGVYQKTRKLSCSWVTPLNYLTLVVLNIFIHDDISVMQSILELHILVLCVMCLLDKRCE